MLLRWSRLLVVGMVLFLGFGCRSAFDAGGKQDLPPAPTKFSDYEPDHPYELTGDGVAERSVFTAPSAEGYTVEVRDFLVSPRNPEALVRIVGGAVLEVRLGSGEAKVDGGTVCEGEVCEEKILLRPGIVFTVDTGKKLYVTASDEPLALRTWIVSAGGKP